MDLYLYNTLTRKKEKFVPIKGKKVGLYSCGPTVYYHPTIGNWRPYVFVDTLKRVLKELGYEVTHVMNYTDVGHMTMTEEQKEQAEKKGKVEITDVDIGLDRMEKAAQREGKSPREIANFYIKDFENGMKLLNINFPTVRCRATEHIKEQIDLIKVLMEKGYAYKNEHAVYFDVTKFKDYGKLSHQSLDEKLVGVRDDVVVDQGKRHPSDFRLWQLDQKDHLQQWDSPWGRGFPGWHIECSAMSMKYLGNHFDIHTGGIDHIPVHHENEIAQSEVATGELLANYWLHVAFITVDGGRMGKSLGNAYVLQDIIDKSFDPLDLRYFYLTAHYRKTLDFTWDNLKAAAAARKNLLEKASIALCSFSVKPENIKVYNKSMYNEFMHALVDDINTANALSVLWNYIKGVKLSKENAIEFIGTIKKVDDLLGLNITKEVINKLSNIDEKEVHKLLQQRGKAKQNKDYSKADEIKNKLSNMGIKIYDTTQGMLWGGDFSK